MSKKLVFIIGNSRSGTTMTARILGKSNEIFAFNELHYFEGFLDVKRLEDQPNPKELHAAVTFLMKNGYDGYFEKNPSSETIKIIEEFIDKELASEKALTFSEIFQKTLARIENGEASLLVDQTPKNIFFIKELRSSFPDAKFVLLVRDPRSILLSQKHKWRRRFMGASNIPLSEALRSWTNYNPITISKLWNANMQVAVREIGESDLMIVQYEHLVTDPELYVKDMSDFLGVKFDPTMLDIPKIGSSLTLDESGKRGIRTGNLSTWKENLSKADIYICEKICAQFMKKFNYELSGTKSNSYFLAVLAFPLKLGLSLVLNLKTVKNIPKAIKRRLM